MVLNFSEAVIIISESVILYKLVSEKGAEGWGGSTRAFRGGLSLGTGTCCGCMCLSDVLSVEPH